MKATYAKIPDGGFVKLDRAFKTECCDCGLVHLWQLKGGKRPGFIVTRDNRATAQRRRKRGV